MTTALVVIDLQLGMQADVAEGFPWANPDAVGTASRILAAFRSAGQPVVHIHHHATDPEDGFHPDNPLSAVIPDVAPVAGEVVVIKRGSSAFIGTGLEKMLRDAGHDSLVIVGGEANMCVESTTRMAGNLGFNTTVVADALVNFGRKRRDGALIAPQDVLDMTLANLRGFATIKDSAEVLAEVSA
jgi:nicotinamidase-related amidase